MNKTQTSLSPDTPRVSPVAMQSSTSSPTPHLTFNTNKQDQMSSEMEKNHPHSSSRQFPPIQTSFCRLINLIPSISRCSGYLEKFQGRTPGRKPREVQINEGMGDSEVNAELCCSTDSKLCHSSSVPALQHRRKPHSPEPPLCIEAPGAAPNHDLGKLKAQE